VSVREVEELERDALLVGSAAKGREQHVDEAGISWALIEAAVLEGGEWDCGVGDCDGSCCLGRCDCWLRWRRGVAVGVRCYVAVDFGHGERMIDKL